MKKAAILVFTVLRWIGGVSAFLLAFILFISGDFSIDAYLAIFLGIILTPLLVSCFHRILCRWAYKRKKYSSFLNDRQSEDVPQSEARQSDFNKENHAFSLRVGHWKRQKIYVREIG